MFCLSAVRPDRRDKPMQHVGKKPRVYRHEVSPDPSAGCEDSVTVLLTVFRQVVFPLFSLHLLAPPFHAVSLRLEKLQKPVAVSVAH